jgi:hypothetical protein
MKSAVIDRPLHSMNPKIFNFRISFNVSASMDIYYGVFCTVPMVRLE